MCNAYLKAVQYCEFGELYLVGNSDPDYETTFDNALKTMIKMADLENIETKQFLHTRPTQVPFLILIVLNLQNYLNGNQNIR